jgi:hypothetical protein
MEGRCRSVASRCLTQQRGGRKRATRLSTPTAVLHQKPGWSAPRLLGRDGPDLVRRPALRLCEATSGRSAGQPAKPPGPGGHRGHGGPRLRRLRSWRRRQSPTTTPPARSAAEQGTPETEAAGSRERAARVKYVLTLRAVSRCHRGVGSARPPAHPSRAGGLSGQGRPRAPCHSSQRWQSRPPGCIRVWRVRS